MSSYPTFPTKQSLEEYYLETGLQNDINDTWKYLDKFIHLNICDKAATKKSILHYNIAEHQEEDGAMSLAYGFRKNYITAQLLKKMAQKYKDIDENWELMQSCFRTLKPLIEQRFVKYWEEKLNRPEGSMKKETHDSYYNDYSPFFKSMNRHQ